MNQDQRTLSSSLNTRRMAVLHRAFFTWFICLMFLILLVLRLDERVRWSWFIVFIPLWLYDSILLIYLIFSMVSHCRTSHDRGVFFASSGTSSWWCSSKQPRSCSVSSWRTSA